MKIRSSIIAVSGLVVLAAYGSLSAQPIYHMVTGERPIEKVADIGGEHVMPKYGRPCGEYFLFYDSGDRRSLAFKIAVTAKDRDTSEGSRFIDTKFVTVKVDDQKKVPTARYIKPGIFVGTDPELLIRISRQDYEAAECLRGVGTR